jgi:hypothetical protein
MARPIGRKGPEEQQRKRPTKKTRKRTTIRAQREESTYAIGYRKPPRYTRFKPGKSGNPNGRPKARPNLRRSLLRVLMSRIQVTVGGKTLKVPRYEAVMWKQMENAMKGSSRAAEWLIRNAGDEAPELKFDHNLDLNSLSDEQLDVLEAHLRAKIEHDEKTDA